MSNNNRILSDNSKIMISQIKSSLDKGPLLVFTSGIDPTILEICDALDYFIKSGWIAGTLFARKVTYINGDKILPGVLFTEQEADFENYKGSYSPVEDSPLVIGLDHDSDTTCQYKNAFPQETVLVKFDDGKLLTRDEYQKSIEPPIQYKKKRES